MASLIQNPESVIQPDPAARLRDAAEQLAHYGFTRLALAGEGDSPTALAAYELGIDTIELLQDDTEVLTATEDSKTAGLIPYEDESGKIYHDAEAGKSKIDIILSANRAMLSTLLLEGDNGLIKAKLVAKPIKMAPQKIAQQLHVPALRPSKAGSYFVKAPGPLIGYNTLR